MYSPAIILALVSLASINFNSDPIEYVWVVPVYQCGGNGRLEYYTDPPMALDKSQITSHKAISERLIFSYDGGGNPGRGACTELGIKGKDDDIIVFGTHSDFMKQLDQMFDPNAAPKSLYPDCQ